MMHGVSPLILINICNAFLQFSLLKRENPSMYHLFAKELLDWPAMGAVHIILLMSVFVFTPFHVGQDKGTECISSFLVTVVVVVFFLCLNRVANKKEHQYYLFFIPHHTIIVGIMVSRWTSVTDTWHVFVRPSVCPYLVSR